MSESFFDGYLRRKWGEIEKAKILEADERAGYLLYDVFGHDSHRFDAFLADQGQPLAERMRIKNKDLSFDGWVRVGFQGDLQRQYEVGYKRKFSFKRRGFVKEYTGSFTIRAGEYDLTAQDDDPDVCKYIFTGEEVTAYLGLGIGNEVSLSPYHVLIGRSDRYGQPWQVVNPFIPSDYKLETHFVFQPEDEDKVWWIQVTGPNGRRTKLILYSLSARGLDAPFFQKMNAEGRGWRQVQRIFPMELQTTVKR